MELSAVLTPAPEGGYIAYNPETGTTTQGGIKNTEGRFICFTRKRKER